MWLSENSTVWGELLYEISKSNWQTKPRQTPFQRYAQAAGGQELQSVIPEPPGKDAHGERKSTDTAKTQQLPLLERYYSMRKSQFLLVYDQLLYLNGLLQIMDRVFKKASLENRKPPFVPAPFSFCISPCIIQTLGNNGKG